MKIDDAINKILEFELDERHYPELPNEFWKNEEFIIKCLEHDHHPISVFNYIDKTMWSNKKFMLSLIKFMKTKGEDLKELDDICDECKQEDESVSQNLILTGFKICKSCRVSKTIFPF